MCGEGCVEFGELVWAGWKRQGVVAVAWRDEGNEVSSTRFPGVAGGGQAG